MSDKVYYYRLAINIQLIIRHLRILTKFETVVFTYLMQIN